MSCHTCGIVSLMVGIMLPVLCPQDKIRLARTSHTLSIANTFLHSQVSNIFTTVTSAFNHLPKESLGDTGKLKPAIDSCLASEREEGY